MRRIGICCVLSLLLMAAVARAAPLGPSRSASTAASKLYSARPKSAGAVLLGHRAIQPTVGQVGPGQADAFPFAVRRAGTISAVRVFVDARNKAKKLMVALYSSRSGKPLRRVTSGTLSSPKNGAWNKIPVMQVEVRSQRTYWIAVLGRGGTLYFRDHKSGPCHAMTYANADLPPMPRMWTSKTRMDGCAISAYATGRATTTTSAATTTFGILAPVFPPANTTGTTTFATVAPAAPALPPAAIGVPVISGQMVRGQMLSTSSGSWTGSPTAYGYQWQDCNSSGASCTTISGATQSTYTLTSPDVGHTIRSVVTATNSRRVNPGVPGRDVRRHRARERALQHGRAGGQRATAQRADADARAMGAGPEARPRTGTSGRTATAAARAAPRSPAPPRARTR